MRSITDPAFWEAFNKLPVNIQERAREKFELWQSNRHHPSLNFKCVDKEDDLWSVRVSINYRAVGTKVGDDIVWYWIGEHKTYEKIIK